MSNHTAGLDWGAYQHSICVIDAHGSVRARFDVPHTREGLERLLRDLRRISPPERLPIAIERPNGLLVDTLQEAGHPVVAIHPNAVKASRARYRAALSKSDTGDALLLADLLRTDAHRFTPLTPRSDGMRAVRALARARDDLVRHKVMLANQLRAQLEHAWPGAVGLFADLASPIALAFLRRYPTLGSTRALGPKRMAAFLASHRYSGRRTPEELLERLRAAPTPLVAECETEASHAIVLALVSTLEVLTRDLGTLTRDLEHASANTAIGQLVMSFPRAGRTNAALIAAEIGDDPNRYQTRDHLASEAGVAPVTRASGRSHAVVARYACNKRLKNALTTFANNSRFEDPWARGLYERARARGHRHPHAVRIVARAWVRVLHACWRDGTLYDPALMNRAG